MYLQSISSQVCNLVLSQMVLNFSVEVWPNSLHLWGFKQRIPFHCFYTKNVYKFYGFPQSIIHFSTWNNYSKSYEYSCINALERLPTAAACQVFCEDKNHIPSKCCDNFKLYVCQVYSMCVVFSIVY